MIDIKVSSSPQGTKQIAQKILKKHLPLLKQKCLIFALEGELGSGKTQFAQGLGRGLAIEKNIVSPTFTLLREYPFKVNKKNGFLYHLDTWRIKKAKEVIDLKIEKILQPGHILVIEWAEKIKKLLIKWSKKLPVKIIWIKMEHLKGNRRKIKIIT